jgi:hypothetical protein
MIIMEPSIDKKFLKPSLWVKMSEASNWNRFKRCFHFLLTPGLNPAPYGLIPFQIVKTPLLTFECFAKCIYGLEFRFWTDIFTQSCTITTNVRFEHQITFLPKFVESTELTHVNSNLFSKDI